MLLNGQLAPGAELSQVGLARRLGISTTPLREALRQLEAEGLVETRRNRRPRVPPFDPLDLEAVYSGRVVLESLGIALSVPLMTDDDYDALRTSVDEMRDAGIVADFSRWEPAHLAFHAGLIARCGPPLRQQILTLAARSDRYRRMSVLGQHPAGWVVGEAEHEALLEACMKRDPRAAAGLLARHLTRSALTVVAHLAPDADPVGVRLALQMVLSWADSDQEELDPRAKFA
jgi:DNA-binding GntR family transcriptional regulator